MTGKILDVKELTKRFNTKIVLDNISFDIEEGVIFGLLGPNGAGKTTMIRIILDIIKADHGDIDIFGRKFDDALKARIGYLPEERGLYQKITVFDCLNYFAELKEVKKSNDKIDFWLNKVDLYDYKKKKIEELSKGMQQKVQLVAAFIHDPELLILDEPFSGLDPINTKLIKDILLDLKREGKTIILSTHQMDQVERMCDRILLINQGKRILYGSLDEIKSNYKESVVVEYEGELKPIEGVKTKSFIFVLILPLLIILPMVIAMGLIPQMALGTPRSIGFVDDAGMLQANENFTKFGDFETGKRALLDDDINAFFVIHKNYRETGNVTLYSRAGLFSSPPTSLIETFLRDSLLEESKIDETLKERIKEPAKEKRITLNEKGEVEEKGGAGFFIPYVLAILLMLAIMTSSGYLMQGIVIEKESKTVEILLSSLTADELLTGKIIGFGSAGLLQVVIWSCMVAVAIVLTPLSALFQGIPVSGILILAVVYFILGYLLFAGSMACVAAPASTVRDAQQGATIFTLFAILPMILLTIIINAPNSIIAKVLTYIPYTTSITTLMRISLVEVPVYELVASLAILTISVIIAIKLSAKIFRAGILMYGQKMNLKEVWRYLRE
jgi:ABC-type uncharacterized transport system ATPase subunit/ABC-type Na+ efflux pump permease subunit